MILIQKCDVTFAVAFNVHTGSLFEYFISFMTFMAAGLSAKIQLFN